MRGEVGCSFSLAGHIQINGMGAPLKGRVSSEESLHARSGETRLGHETEQR